ncbi:hypothetical protein [Pseudomonas putida]|uniref:hypothetical protein n=1 Tax=Pseudomonas putida TaxID=303 RepID=UPI0011AF5C40|nr:hypothetical protein [Pseudomonas putida]
MSLDSFTRGLKRATAQRKQRQSKEQDANAVNNKPVFTKRKPALAGASAFDLEHYRVELINKAIAYINNKQRK